MDWAYHLFTSKPAAIGATTICVMLYTMSKSDNNGVTKTAVAVPVAIYIDVMTMLRGAIVESVKKVA